MPYEGATDIKLSRQDALRGITRCIKTANGAHFDICQFGIVISLTAMMGRYDGTGAHGIAGIVRV
jgi:hypothetical protein